MKINIVKQEPDYLELEFGDEGHTMLNLLQSSLLRDPDIEMAGYSKPHPLMDRAHLFIRMREDGDCLEALKRASGVADGLLDEFLECFESSLAELN